MRNAPTEPEKRLWMALRNSQLEGFKFRRQSVIGQRIVDFFCPARALIVEVDGDTHDATVDVRRDAELSEQGFTTLRFTNREVCDNMDGVLTVILDLLRTLPERWPHPHPSPEGEGPSC